MNAYEQNNPNDNKQSMISSNRSLKQSMITRFDHQKYSIMVEASTFQILFYEAIGMFLFVYGSYCFSKAAQIDGQSIISIFLGLSMVGYLSSANFNPAITIANCLIKQSKYKPSMILTYFIAQLIGSMLALTVSSFLNDTEIKALVPIDSNFSTLARILIGEMIGVFILVIFILQISNPNTTFVQNQLSGYVTVSIFFYIARKYSMASQGVINISIQLSLALFTTFKGDYEGIKWIWLWALGNLCGALLAPMVSVSRKVRQENSILNLSKNI